jgi:hypothetical protein
MDARASSESIDVEIIPPSGFQMIAPSTCVGVIAPGKPVEFRLRTAPYNRNVTVVLLPRVELSDVRKVVDGN